MQGLGKKGLGVPFQPWTQQEGVEVRPKEGLGWRGGKEPALPETHQDPGLHCVTQAPRATCGLCSGLNVNKNPGETFLR